MGSDCRCVFKVKGGSGYTVIWNDVGSAGWVIREIFLRRGITGSAKSRLQYVPFCSLNYCC